MAAGPHAHAATTPVLPPRWAAPRFWKSGQVQILIAERSSMTVDPELFRSHGIDPVHCKIVVVKSPNGFRAAYEPIAKGIFLVDTPGREHGQPREASVQASASADLSARS